MNKMKQDTTTVEPKLQQEGTTPLVGNHRYYRELQRRESVTFKVRQALEGHAQYLESQMELIRTSFGTVEEDDDDDDSLRAEVEYLAEDERSIYNDLEELMNSFRSNSERDAKQNSALWMLETEETVAGTFSESSGGDQFFEEDEDEPSPQGVHKQIIQVIPPSPARSEGEVARKEVLVKKTFKDLGEEKGTPLPSLRKVEYDDTSASSSVQKPPRRRTSVTFREDVLETAVENYNPHQQYRKKVVLDFSPLKRKNDKQKEQVDSEETQSPEADNEGTNVTSSDADDISILEQLEILVESLRSLSPEEFLKEFDDRSLEGDPSETKEQRMNYLIDLLTAKAQDMYIQGEGLNLVYASGLLAVRIHAERNALSGTMLPCWFRRILQTVQDDHKRPHWALAPTLGSASADGKHFMPLCDSDDYHEQDPMLSDLEEWDEEE